MTIAQFDSEDRKAIPTALWGFFQRK